MRVYGIFLALLAVTSQVHGQDTAAKPPASSEATASETLERQLAEADAGSKQDRAVRNEHVIYLPYENLREALDGKGSSVVLPYAQYMEMWGRLTELAGPAQTPPVNGVLTRADYVGSIQGDVVRLEGTLDIEVLSSGWAKLPVEFGDAAIGTAEAEDGDVLLRGVGDGRYELLVQGQGKHQLKLALMLGVTSTADGRSFSMRCPAVGVCSLQLEIPESDVAVQVSPRCTTELQARADNATQVRAVLGSTNQFTVSWQPKSGSTDQAAGLANVNDTIAIDVGDGVVHTHAMLDYQILRGALGDLVVELPAAQRLLDVQAPGMRDWQTEKSESSQRVTVRLHAPATGSIRLELHTESPILDEAFPVSGIRAVGVARESGLLAVRSAEDVGLEIAERESITRIDGTDAPESLQKPRTAFYKFFTPDHKLSVLVSQLQPRIVVDGHLAVLLGKVRVTTRGQFHIQVTRSGVFSLEFRLPSGLQVEEVRVDAMERFEVVPAEQSQVLTVYFTKKMLGELDVDVIASQPYDSTAGQLALPLIEPLNATREQGLVAVIAPESLEIKTDAVQLQAARSATPAELVARGFDPEIPAGSALAAAFSFAAHGVGIVQTISARPRRTAAVVSTVANVKEDVVQVATTLQYDIQYAGTDTFLMAVPGNVSDRLRVDGEGIKERRRSETVGSDGTVQWTIVLHAEVIGDFSFVASYDQPISVPEQGTELELRPIQALDVERESGEFAIQKDRALSIAAITTGLEEIDPRELSSTVGATQPYLTYRYFEHPAQLTLNVTKHELQDVVKTVVRHAYIEAVITEDGPITIRARYELKSSERQRLALTLRNPRILGLAVAGQSVAPEKGPTRQSGHPDDRTYLINVARTSDSDERFQIVMVFETPLPGGALAYADLLRLPLPQFDEGVKIQQVYVRVWVPKDYRLVGDPAGFTGHIGVGLWDSRRIDRAPDNPDSWFSDDATTFDFQVGGTTYLFSSLSTPDSLQIGYWHIPTMTLIASLAVLMVGLVLVPFSVDVKVSTILLAVIAAALASLFLPSVVHSWLLAARLGIAGVIAVWLVIWLLLLRRQGYFRPASRPPRVADVMAATSSAAAGVLVHSSQSAVDVEASNPFQTRDADQPPGGPAGDEPLADGDAEQSGRGSDDK